jgi:hypothetical protein
MRLQEFTDAKEAHDFCKAMNDDLIGYKDYTIIQEGIDP